MRNHGMKRAAKKGFDYVVSVGPDSATIYVSGSPRSRIISKNSGSPSPTTPRDTIPLSEGYPLFTITNGEPNLLVYYEIVFNSVIQRSGTLTLNSSGNGSFVSDKTGSGLGGSTITLNLKKTNSSGQLVYTGYYSTGDYQPSFTTSASTGQNLSQRNNALWVDWFNTLFNGSFYTSQNDFLECSSLLCPGPAGPGPDYLSYDLYEQQVVNGAESGSPTYVQTDEICSYFC